MVPQTIDEVIHELGLIVETSIHENDRLGIFALIYKRTTEQIRAEILKGNFENNLRLEQFDVLFANYYLDAYHRYKAGESVSDAWKVAFEAKNEQLTILQHILLGMNAHINLDLAVAASEIMDGLPIEELKNDFLMVNEILANLLDEMQQKVSRVSLLVFLLDWIGKRTDEQIINFSMVKARAQSWKVANELWSLKGVERKDRQNQVDLSISKLGLFIKKPPTKLLRTILRIISWLEDGHPSRIIQKLSD